MKKFIKKTIGKDVHNFVVEGANLHEVLMESNKLSFPNVYKCGICNGFDLELDAHVAQGFTYTTVRCMNKNCRASLNFGQQKLDPTIFYLKTNEDKSLAWKKFQPKQQ